jgi:hypothetical protein
MNSIIAGLFSDNVFKIFIAVYKIMKPISFIRADNRDVQVNYYNINYRKK